MKAKRIAERLIKKFQAFDCFVVYNDTEDGVCVTDRPMLQTSAQKCAAICVEQILNVLAKTPNTKTTQNKKLLYQDVFREIKQYESKKTVKKPKEQKTCYTCSNAKKDAITKIYYCKLSDTCGEKGEAWKPIKKKI